MNLSFKVGNISDDILSKMDEDQMRTLLIDAHDTLSSATPAPSIFVQPSNLFTTPFPFSSPASISSTLFISPFPVSSSATISYLAPKMDRVRSVASSVSFMTFNCSLIVLDTKISVDHTFGLDPIMIQIIKHRKRQCATEKEIISFESSRFCNFYRLHIFCNSIQLKYVGNAFYDLQKMLADICLALSNFQIIYDYSHRTISLTYENLFSRYTEFLSLFSPNALTW